MQCNHHTFARPSGAPQSTAQTQYGRAYRPSGVARLASRGNALFRNGSSKCTRTIFGVILSDMIWQPHDHWINSEEWHRRRWHILWLGIPTFFWPSRFLESESDLFREYSLPLERMQIHYKTSTTNSGIPLVHRIGKK